MKYYNLRKSLSKHFLNLLRSAKIDKSSESLLKMYLYFDMAPQQNLDGKFS